MVTCLPRCSSYLPSDLVASASLRAFQKRNVRPALKPKQRETLQEILQHSSHTCANPTSLNMFIYTYIIHITIHYQQS